MNRFFLFPILFFSLVTLTVAQEDEMPQTDEEAVQMQRGGLIGGGGGVTPMWFFVKTTELNASMRRAMMPELTSSGMFMMGGAGFGYVGFIKNVRIGGLGAGGDISEVKIVDGRYKSTQLSMSFGGVTLEFAIPIGDVRFVIGGLLGGGGSTLTLIDSPNASKSWDSILDQYKNSTATNGTRHDFSNAFFAYQPMLSFEYVPHPLVTLRVTGGWFGSSGGTWKMDDEFTVANIPDFKFANGFIQLGVFVGAFL